MLERILLLFLLITSVKATLSCKNQADGAVPWFTVFKLRGGVQFLYADAEDDNLIASSSNLDNLNNVVARTIAPIYKLKSDNTSNFTNADISEELNYLMYNDEVPGGKVSNNRGHTKGVVMFDDTSLVWLVHSTPHFPNQRALGYEFPSKGTRYGQSFLCINMPISELPKVARQLLYSWPCIYEYKVADNIRTKLEDLDMVLKGKHITTGPWTNVEYLHTIGTSIITSFAKFTDFYADIYNDLISPYLKIDLFTETWQNGPGRLQSNCSQANFVKNIISMDLLGNEYKETTDHSKWAVSDDGGTSMLCIGGINRMSSQFHRPGASFCLASPKLWTVIRHSIVEFEEC